jgi:hypothetical protein
MTHLTTSDDKISRFGLRRWLSSVSHHPTGPTERVPVWQDAGQTRSRPRPQRLKAFQRLLAEHDRGNRQFEAAPYGTRARAPRYSPGPGQQQLGDAQSRPNQRSRGLIPVNRPAALGVCFSRGVSHATAFFPSPPRCQRSGDVSQFFLERTGREISPRRSLYARSRAEMAGEAFSRPRIRRWHVG